MLKNSHENEVGFRKVIDFIFECRKFFRNCCVNRFIRVKFCDCLLKKYVIENKCLRKVYKNMINEATMLMCLINNMAWS